MSTPHHSVEMLNDSLEEIIRLWATIIDLDLCVSFGYSDEMYNPATDLPDAYEFSQTGLPGLGVISIGSQGTMQMGSSDKASYNHIVIKAPVSLGWQDALQVFVNRHTSSNLFDNAPQEMMFDAVLRFDNIRYSENEALFVDALISLKLNGLSETLVRPNADALCQDLLLLIPWLRYAAHHAGLQFEYTRRVVLAADTHLLVRYLSQGGQLNFAKLTSLCDLTGSLQPVRNLILSEMPELAA